MSDWPASYFVCKKIHFSLMVIKLVKSILLMIIRPIGPTVNYSFRQNGLYSFLMQQHRLQDIERLLIDKMCLGLPIQDVARTVDNTT